MKLSQKEFAEYIGVHKATISKMKKRHEIVFSNKKVDVKKTMELLRSIGKTFNEDNKMISSNTSPAPKKSQQKNIFEIDPASYPKLTLEEKAKQEEKLLEREMKSQAEEFGLEIDDILTPEINSMDKHEVEKVKIFYQGMIERAKYFKEIGKLIEVDQVREDNFTIARTVRDAFLGMGNRTAHKFLNQTDLHTVKDLFDAEVMKVLENLSL